MPAVLSISVKPIPDDTLGGLARIQMTHPLASLDLCQGLHLDEDNRAFHFDLQADPGFAATGDPVVGLLRNEPK